jgi:zinc and cadmium transporter
MQYHFHLIKNFTLFMILLNIIFACLFVELGSMFVAQFLVMKIPAKKLSLMVAFSAGTMLSVGIINVIPEALEAENIDSHLLFTVLLAALIFFNYLERMSLWHHQHLHDRADEREQTPSELRPVVWSSLIGDSIHNFVDGVVIATAFIADPMLGVTTATAILIHEIPHRLGDFAVYLAAGLTKKNAMLVNLASAMVGVLGGILGWYILHDLEKMTPYVLMVAAGSFIYIALSDLFPYLTRRQKIDGIVNQSSLLAVGVLWVPVLGQFIH